MFCKPPGVSDAATFGLENPVETSWCSWSGAVTIVTGCIWVGEGNGLALLRAVITGVYVHSYSKAWVPETS